MTRNVACDVWEVLSVLLLIYALIAPSTTAVAAPSELWGRIANPGLEGQKILAALYFAGRPNPSSLPLYTRHSLRVEPDDWNDEEQVKGALQDLAYVGLNTIKLSYWGHQGETERWSPALLFAGPEPDAVARGKVFFRAAASLGLTVAPMLEVSPAFPFYQEFPYTIENLVTRAEWLLRHFGKEPNWLWVYDREGYPRLVIWLIETIHLWHVDPEDFARGFDLAAQRIKTDMGVDVGFIIDPTPLPAYGSHEGPDPEFLRRTSSILAINPFNITSQGLGLPRPQDQIDERDRLAYAESVLSRWMQSGMPLIAPIIPGYDAHIVFPGTGVYGFNETWRRRQQQLVLEYETAGLSIDTWNGWTEGYAIPPSREDGEVHLQWVAETIALLKAKWGDVTDE